MDINLLVAERFNRQIVRIGVASILTIALFSSVWIDVQTVLNYQSNQLSKKLEAVYAQKKRILSHELRLNQPKIQPVGMNSLPPIFPVGKTYETLTTICTGLTVTSLDWTSAGVTVHGTAPSLAAIAKMVQRATEFQMSVQVQTVTPLIVPGGSAGTAILSFVVIFNWGMNQ